MSAPSGRTVRMAYLVASVAGVVFFALSVVLLGLLPTRALNADMRAMGPEKLPSLTASEQRGRAVYAREGCAYCHTQQVRYLDADMDRFGAPTLAWETQFDYPHMWGTRRIGPDLAREGGTRSDDWQFAHLYAPRDVVPLSVMPAYAALFDGAPNRPTNEGRDLVAYLATLGRARELASPEGEARAREACHCPGDEMAMMAFHMKELNAHPARTRRTGVVPALPPAGDRTDGARLYQSYCAGCHGPTGLGDGPGAAGLRPRPSSLAAHRYSSTRIAETLWNGVAGTAMPAWRDQPLTRIAALVAAVQSFGANAGLDAASGLSATGPLASEPLLDRRPDGDAGARVYAANCVQCHGERGGGDGFSAAALAIAPTNFQQQQPTTAAALLAVTNGIDGTPMAPWTSRLSDADITAVVQYVRSFYAGNGSIR